eukprot:CAMPEP_0197071284 /NCGR_PEP_ID=MMETSP1384-20130603/205632_1 /TAXON_ID=29189 /ORGANISM="Ammonia sp." /LENGTH=54 /DNA_ID=CAMNT_0042509877 /DNA_START=41 /DNA_END=201 /DNA_ORIENTATION=-
MKRLQSCGVDGRLSARMAERALLFVDEIACTLMMISLLMMNNNAVMLNAMICDS